MQIGSRNIRMENRGTRTFQRFDRAADQRFAHLGQHTDPDIIRNMISLDQRTRKIKIVLRRRGKRDFNLFESDFRQQFEIFQFLDRIHRHGKRLVAVAKIHGAPCGRVRKFPLDPFPFRHGNTGWTLVFRNHHTPPCVKFCSVPLIIYHVSGK